MIPAFLVIGLDYHTVPVGLRDRFWIGEGHRYQALVQLCESEGVEEAIVLATCSRTEFILWASDASAASNSVVAFLKREYGLRASEWQSFHRKLDESAIAHVFRLAGGFDSGWGIEPEIQKELVGAWRQAHQIGSSGRILDLLCAHAMFACKRAVRAEEHATPAIDEEVRRFCDILRTIDTLTPLQALHTRVEDLARLEVEHFRCGEGPLDTEQEQKVEALAARIAQRITSAMTREWNGVERKHEQHELTTAIQRLLRTERSEPASAVQKN